MNIINAARGGAISSKNSGGGEGLISLSQSVLPPKLLPFSPDVDEWTEEHFQMFEYVELAVGHYREISEEERADLEKADKIGKKMERGEEWKSEFANTMEEDEILSIEELLDMDADEISRIGRDLDKSIEESGIEL